MGVQEGYKMDKKELFATSKNWASLRMILSRYQQPSRGRSLWQFISSFCAYGLLWYLMVLSLRVSYLLTLLLAVLAAGFMMRLFIIFHDCGHGSFFKTRWGNDLVGTITGFLTFTPYHHWKHDHAIHHATAGDLDRRGVGDVFTMTVREYQELPWWRRLVYRIWRHPLVMFPLGAFLVFSVFHRFHRPGSGSLERRSVILTNLVLAGMIAVLVYLLGWQTYLMLQIPVLLVASTVGVWLFYVQHNFEGTYWVRHADWDFIEAGLQGSSFYKLPALLQWFSGNIGFHHIHHLNARIPNYLLPACYRENPIFHVRPLTILSSLRSLNLRLWDEETSRMVGFGFLKGISANANV
jgi:omega-6 fatty acid desaturase (delta-12 desaturase)